MQWQPVSRYDVFCAAFDRAYALGREKEVATTQQDYKSSELECWCDFCNTEVARRNSFDKALVKAANNFAFFRGYRLGKQKETISQEEIENKAVDYAFSENKKRPDARPDTMPEYTCEDLIDAFKAGANFALGKQEKDAEGEEMLMVPRKRVQEMFAANERSKAAFAGTEIASESEQINHVLFSFFGDKCLPDEPSLEPKPAKLKFNDGRSRAAEIDWQAIGSLQRLAPCGYCFIDHETPYRIVIESLDDMEDLELLK